MVPRRFGAANISETSYENCSKIQISSDTLIDSLVAKGPPVKVGSLLLEPRPATPFVERPLPRNAHKSKFQSIGSRRRYAFTRSRA